MSAATASTQSAPSGRSAAAFEATCGWRPLLPPEEAPVFVWSLRPWEALPRNGIRFGIVVAGFSLAFISR